MLFEGEDLGGELIGIFEVVGGEELALADGEADLEVEPAGAGWGEVQAAAWRAASLARPRVSSVPAIHAACPCRMRSGVLDRSIGPVDRPAPADEWHTSCMATTPGAVSSDDVSAARKMVHDVMLSGGNIDPLLLAKLLRHGLTAGYTLAFA